MDGQRTPPRDDAEAEPDVPLRERMERLQDELLDARELLERVAPGAPRVHAPVTVTEAFEMMDAAQAAKAKENVRPSTPARHLEARRAAVPRARADRNPPRLAPITAAPGVGRFSTPRFDV